LSFIGSCIPRSGIRSGLAASSAAIALLALVLVFPAAAVSGPTKLLNASVSPRTASPTTSITFTVSYRNRYGDAPVYVRVLIDGAARAMRVADSQLDYHGGVRYRLVTTLALGKHQIGFTASDARKFTDTIQAGTVTITRPASGDGTDGGATSDGSSGSGGTGSGSSPSAGSTESTGTSSGSTAPDANHRDSSVARYEPAASSAGTTSPTTPQTPGGPVSGNAAGSASGNGSGNAGVSAGVSAGGAANGGSGADGQPAAPQGAGLAIFGPVGAITIEQRMLVTAISTTTTTLAAMAFLFFGKRRRDGEPPAPDEVLAGNAALMTAVPTATAAQVIGGYPGSVSGEPDESGMPRWRRPSLMAARKGDPARDVVVPVKLSFDDGPIDPLDGHERRRIKYRVVRLLDAPDELRSNEVGLLDEGDEVQLLERSGSFWLVLCPDGSEGWVHRMTLGDIVDEGDGGRPDRSFADATDDIDADVLSAYLRVKGLP
jgi:hypothetical protein